MTKLKSLIIGKVKDKASIGKARLVHSFSSTSIKYIHLALLKSTTHSSNQPPNTDYVSDVISYSNSPYAPAAFSAALWRLRITKNAFVAIKTLIVIHKLIKSSKDKFDGLDHGRNILKMNEFSDKSSSLALELSRWIRWYGQYLDHLSLIPKVLGSSPNLMETQRDKAKEEDCVSSYQTKYIMRQTDSLVSLFGHMSNRPETPAMFENKIVDEIRELVIQDYFMVIELVLVRLQVLRQRLIKPGSDQVNDSVLKYLIMVLVRLEELKENLSGFKWRCRRWVEDLWCFVETLKAEIANDYKEIQNTVTFKETATKWEISDDSTNMVRMKKIPVHFR